MRSGNVHPRELEKTPENEKKKEKEETTQGSGADDKRIGHHVPPFADRIHSIKVRKESPNLMG